VRALPRREWQATRDYLGDDLPGEYPEDSLVRDIDRAVRAMVPEVLRWPTMDDTAERAADEYVRDELIAAVAELLKYRHEQKAAAAALGGAGTAEILAAGGSISAGKTSVSGGRGTQIGRHAETLPYETVQALSNAGMVGGSVATC
jgi:hypothetical protein